MITSLLMTKSGIYEIVCLVTNDRYIGSAIDIKRRWREHKSYLNRNLNFCPHLQKAWNKYGESNFIFSIIEEVDVDLLIEREQYYIDTEKPKYNVCKIAGNTLGRKHTEETKKKISETCMGRPSVFRGRKHTEETRKKISEKRKGVKRKPCSEETKKKISDANKGRVFTEEHKEKLKSHNGKKPINGGYSSWNT